MIVSQGGIVLWLRPRAVPLLRASFPGVARRVPRVVTDRWHAALDARHGDRGPQLRARAGGDERAALAARPRRGAAAGLLGAFTSLGFLLGPLIGAVLYGADRDAPFTLVAASPLSRSYQDCP